MKRIAWFDCASGISGDMLLGALVDAGLSVSVLNRTLRLVLPGEIRFRSRKVIKAGVQATKVDLLLTAPPKNLKNIQSILSLIQRSRLPAPFKNRCADIFRKMAEGEGAAHRVSPEKVTFQELGGLDTIGDVIGAVAALVHLDIDEVQASPLNLGEGRVKTAHGRIPVPGPATARILSGVPVYSSGIKRELTTPTGAAIIVTLASSFGPLPLMTLKQTGIGGGEAEIPEFPNILRVLIGESDRSYRGDQVCQLETQIDDMNPQGYDLLMERLFQTGALDVSLTPIIMKKGRPAILLSVITLSNNVKPVSDVIFRESSTLGIRIGNLDRIILRREPGELKTPWGEVRIKKSWLNGKMRMAPEYEDCRAIAERENLPLKEVFRLVDRGIEAELQEKTGRRRRS
ncbi:MAG TPA: nickel pincer cofactor biosynthesis protein LarC [Nitrospiria bacterium]|nr:nickel pincer cofactor biosynthesis protein LarC [Nitrospiria bacterium]